MIVDLLSRRLTTLVVLVTVFFCALVIAGLMHPFIGSLPVMGWDLYPHYYVAETFHRNILQGTLTGFDPLWLAGYPSFLYYGPFAYACIELLHLVTFSSRGLAASLNTLVFLLPFLYLSGVCWLVRVYGRTESVLCALLFGLVSLTIPSNHLYGPIGIFGSIYHGHVAAFLGCVQFLFLLGAWEQLRRQPRARWYVIVTVLWFTLLLTHQMTILFAGLVGAIHALMHGKQHFLRMSKCLLIALISSSFWWLPMIRYLGYSSGDKLDMGIVDPLLLLFPDLVNLQGCLTGPRAGHLIGYIFCSLAFAGSAVFGWLVQWRKQQTFLPFTVLVVLLFVPRNFLSGILSLSIHYNRMMLPLVPMVVALAAIGAEQAWRSIRSVRSDLARRAALSCFVVMFAWVAFASSIQDYGPAIRSLAPEWFFSWVDTACDNRPPHSPPVTEGQVLAQSEYVPVANFLKQNTTWGRTAVQVSRYENGFGSPHLLSTLLPMRYNIPVANGLLAESAYSSSFLISTISYLTDSLIWGRSTLVPFYTRQPGIESALRRLALYNVQFIVASSNSTLGQAWNGERSEALASILEARAIFEKLQIFEFKESHSFLETVPQKPFLYVDYGGLPFREVAEKWFESDSLIPFPIISTSKPYEQLTQLERDGISGIILGTQEGQIIDDEELSRWLSTKKPVVVLNATVRTDVLRANSKLRSISLASFSAITESVVKEMLWTSPISRDQVPVIEQSNRGVRFAHKGGVIVNYNYHPRWQSQDPDQTIFEVTPSLMFVFANGETSLFFN